MVDVVLEVNGEAFPLSVDGRLTLLDALRDRLGLRGTQNGCNSGECGACTVHVAGRRVLACLMLAAAAAGSPIVTIEGIAGADELHPMQRAFVDCDALQCGYCTPGQIMSAIGCVREGRATDDLAIAEAMSGNLCRCGAYGKIRAAVKRVAAPHVVAESSE